MAHISSLVLFPANPIYVCPSQSAGVATRTSSVDLVQPDQLLASILTQSASDSDYLKCIMHLLTGATGAEVYLREPPLFGLPTGGGSCHSSHHLFMPSDTVLHLVGTPMSFAAISEAARRYNETALGFRTASGRTILAPAPTDMFTLQAGDRVVAFAADFSVTKAAKSV